MERQLLAHPVAHRISEPDRPSYAHLSGLRKVPVGAIGCSPAKTVFVSPANVMVRDGKFLIQLTALFATLGSELLVAATVCFSESFESLSEGMQNALFELGSVPRTHRSDRMSAAVSNLSERKDFTERYEGLLGHYGMEGRKSQAGKAHENGDIGQRHHRFKRAVEQAHAPPIRSTSARGGLGLARGEHYRHR